MPKKIALKKINKKTKSKALEELKEKLSQYQTIAVIDISNLTSEQITSLRKALKGKDVMILGGRKTLIIKALEELGNKTAARMLKQIKTKLLIALSNEDPFELTLLLDKNMQPAPAKEGMIAPNDIVIPKGKTKQKPGPAISTFTQAGVKTGVEQGFISVKEDTVVTKKGEKVSPAVIKLLTMLGIKPFKQGFYIQQATYHNQIFNANVLHLDLDKFKNEILLAVKRANDLCVGAAIPTPYSVNILIQKAAINAKVLAIASKTISSETMPELLAQATTSAKAIQGLMENKS